MLNPFGVYQREASCKVLWRMLSWVLWNYLPSERIHTAWKPGLESMTTVKGAWGLWKESRLQIKFHLGQHEERNYGSIKNMT